MLAQLDSEYFPTNKADVLKVLQSSPIRRARPSLVKNFITALLKRLFLEEQSDYNASSKLKLSLNAVCTMHRGIYEARCAEIIPDIVSRVEHNSLIRATRHITALHCAWESLDHAQKFRITRYVNQIPMRHFGYMDEFLSFPPLKEAAATRVKFASLDDLDAAVLFFDVPCEIIDRAIEMYHNAKSFEVANRIANQISMYTSDFSDKKIRVLISKIQENTYTLDSSALPKMLERLRKKSSKNQMDFDDLLIEYGLGKHSVKSFKENDEVPF
jgi:hypothetical protein